MNPDNYKRDYSRNVLASRLDNTRAVPGSAAPVLVLGNVACIVGWLVFGIGMIIGWVAITQSDVSSLVLFNGELTEVPATITATAQTSTRENKTYVWSVSYTFTDPAEHEFSGTSYVTGTPMFKQGQASTVEYVKGNPTISRIKGMRAKMLPSWMAVFLIFPLIALVPIFLGLAAGFRNLRLLRTGKLARGRVISTTPTNTTINNRRVMKVTFEFAAEDITLHQASVRTTYPERLYKPEGELLFYDPFNPSRAQAADNLPGGLRVAENGELLPPTAGRLVFAILLPAIVIFGHAAFGLWWFGMPH